MASCTPFPAAVSLFVKPSYLSLDVASAGLSLVPGTILMLAAPDATKGGVDVLDVASAEQAPVPGTHDAVRSPERDKGRRRRRMNKNRNWNDRLDFFLGLVIWRFSDELRWKKSESE